MYEIQHKEVTCKIWEISCIFRVLCNFWSLLRSVIITTLIERIFQRGRSPYVACNDRHAFFTSDVVRNDNSWSCQKVCEALTFLLDNIYI